jgi:hypothetical protein
MDSLLHFRSVMGWRVEEGNSLSVEDHLVAKGYYLGIKYLEYTTYPTRARYDGSCSWKL